MAASSPDRTRAHIEALLAGIQRLHGSGPNPFDYDLWQARAHEVLAALYGAGSAEMARFKDAAAVPGRLPGVHGQAENMTLNIHGPWGIHDRLVRGEAVLRDLVKALS